MACGLLVHGLSRLARGTAGTGTNANRVTH